MRDSAMKGRGCKRRQDMRRVTVAKAPKDHVHLGLCLLYTGSAFRGLQLQAHAPTSHTIEGVLIQAMKDAGVIADVVRGRPEGDQHHFTRACRTDRGVHAIRNMISVFIPNDVFARVGGREGVRDKLNHWLPAMVRVADVMALSGSFIPRHCCNRRVYRYMLPLYALLPPCDTWATLEKYYPGSMSEVQELAKASVSAHRSLYDVPYADLSTLPGSNASPSWVQDTRAKVAYCNALLNTHFTLSRRYHNFSVDIDSNRSGVSAKVVQPNTDEALRVLYRCEVLPRLFFFPCAQQGTPDTDAQPRHGNSWSEYAENARIMAVAATTEDAVPIRAAASGAALPTGTTVLPFLFFQVEGGSFLLNMIRKIVGSLLAVCRGARESMLDEALSPERRVTTPLAPGPYLYLAQSTYHGYDRSLAATSPHARLRTVKDAWEGAVGAAAEAFAFQQIAADVVDVDRNTMPPLDDMLAARDRALLARRPHTISEDVHLSEMKEYKPVLPGRLPWPASGEMTVFLRLLRVHNWNVRPIKLDPDCKALREVHNREERLTEAAERETAAEGPSRTALLAEEGVTAAPTEVEVPDGGTDGWLYLADSEADARAQGQAYFASRWKRARPWEYDDAAEEVGGEDDDPDGAGDSAKSPRRRART